MTDFVLELGKTNQIELSDEAFIDVVLNYAQFLKQPLTLGMFVPCDEDGNILETYDPRHQQAKERVLFEFQLEYLGWDNSDMENNIIEDLLTDGYDYTLTPYALKQIGI